MQLFSADASVVFFSLNFDPKNMKKLPSKVAHNQPSPQPRIDFSYYEISGPDICSLICGEKASAFLPAMNTNS